MSDRELVIGVVGAGAMGGGIAHVAAAAGHRVLLTDANPTATSRAKGAIRKALDRDIEKGRTDAASADALLSRIVEARAITDFEECGIVIEAVLEDLAVKRQLFTSLESVVSPECVLATNTSSLSVAAIAGACSTGDRVVGVHFFNPAFLMPLVEIVPALTTSADVTRIARSLVDSWKKTTVLASDSPGFIVNRIARPFYGEALRQYEEGVAGMATIDWAMREIGGFRMGPFELMDFIGNDVNYAVTTGVFEAFFHDPRYKPALTQRRLVEAGLLGRKSRRGYYDYRDGAPTPEPVMDRALAQSIFDRTIAMLVNEAIDAVFLRVASAADIELAMTKGVNYPKGLLAWGDEIGASVILQRLDALHAEYGEDRYRASALLRRRVLAGAPLVG